MQGALEVLVAIAHLRQGLVEVELLILGLHHVSLKYLILFVYLDSKFLHYSANPSESIATHILFLNILFILRPIFFSEIRGDHFLEIAFVYLLSFPSFEQRL